MKIQAQKKIEFRDIVPSDLSHINRVMRAGKGYWGYPEEGLDRFMETFGIHNEAYFERAFGAVAESPEGTVGYYLFKVNDDGLELDHFFLETHLIGQGYGRLLWNQCIDHAENKGWKEFIFWSDPHSLGFYEHMGATKIAERPMVTLPGHNAPIMKVVLS